MFEETTETTEETESTKINPICVVAGSAIATYAGYRIWKAIKNRRAQNPVVVETVIVEEQNSDSRKQPAGSKS
jgi:nitrogenase subunit NifH